MYWLYYVYCLSMGRMYTEFMYNLCYLQTENIIAPQKTGQSLRTHTSGRCFIQKQQLKRENS